MPDRPSTVISRARMSHLKILLPMIREFYAMDQHEYRESVVLPALAPLLESDEFGVVWLVGQPACGYAVITWGYSLESGGREALLDEIYLRERGVRLGSRAMDAILADLRTRGLERMFLETEAHNEQVRRFYRRCGFREENSVWMVWDQPPA